MARNGNPNIIPFDDAKRMAYERAARGRDAGDAAAREAAGDGRGGRQDGGVSSRTARPAPSAHQGLSVSGASSSRRQDIRLAGVARSARPAPFDGGRPTVSDAASDDALLDSRAREPRAALQTYDPASDDSRPSSRRARSDEKRRSKAKQKAERLFARQFGGDGADASAPSTRAAVYKGEMGRSHRRAFSDLGAGRNGSQSAQRSSRTRATRTPAFSVPPVVAVAGGLVCLVLAAAFLYPTARQYYVESREQARLQAEYDALTARNEAIEGRIDALRTQEGIEDAAREELGWVYEGETAGVVRGLDSSEDGASSAAPDAQVKSGSVPAPETWYSPVLDVVFGYVDPATVQPENTDVSNVSDVSSGESGQSEAS